MDRVVSENFWCRIFRRNFGIFSPGHRFGRRQYHVINQGVCQLSYFFLESTYVIE